MSAWHQKPTPTPSANNRKPKTRLRSNHPTTTSPPRPNRRLKWQRPTQRPNLTAHRTISSHRPQTTKTPTLRFPSRTTCQNRPSPPAEIDDVELEPIETIAPEELQPDPEPAPEPEPDPEPKPAPKPGAGLADQLKVSASTRSNYWGPADPQIVSSDEIRRACKQVEHIVHGCYLRSGRIERIYIINTSCPGLTESTAVHELLHSIYSHLNKDKREELDVLVLDFYDKNPQSARQPAGSLRPFR